MPLKAGDEASDYHQMSGTLGLSGSLKVFGPEGTSIGGPTIIARHTASFGTGWEQPMSGALIVSADLGLTAENPQQRHGAVMYLHSRKSICYLAFKNNYTLRSDGLQGNPVTNTTNRGMFLGLKGPNFYIRNEIPHIVGGDDRGKIILNTQSNEMIVDDTGIKFGSHTSDVHHVTGALNVSELIHLQERTSSPAASSTGAYIYSKDDTGTKEMFVLDSAGNETKISPHNDEGEWEYYSKNTKTGKVVRINMEKMIRKLEQLTGEKFIEDE